MFEDTKGVIRNRKSRHNGQKEKNKRTNKDLQNITQKTKDQATQMLKKDNQFLLHMWHSLCYSCYKPNDKSMNEEGL